MEEWIKIPYICKRNESDNLIIHPLTNLLNMKKVFVGLFVMAAAICFTSCKNEPKADANAPKDGDKQEVKAPEATPEAEPAVDLAALLEKTKAEGEKWTEDEWKAMFKDAMKAAKPMMTEMADMQKKLEEAMTKGDEAAAKKLMEDMENIGKKYEDVQKQLEEFEKITDKNPIAKKLNNDEAFQKEVAKELGMEEFMDM